MPYDQHRTGRILRNGFEAPWWLRNGHAQTLWAGLLRPVAQVAVDHERLDLPDGDELQLAWGPAAPGPIVVVLHGLGGCATSPYILGLLEALAARGMQGVVMQFRGAGERLNRQPRFFHAGETGDLEATVQHVRRRLPGRQLAVVGYSMGGIITLNWLARRGEQAAADMAITVSTPMQLGPCADHLATGPRRIYDRHLVRNLRRLVRRKQMQQALPLDPRTVRRVRTLRQFDDCITGPLHGFVDADDYYARCSPLQRLRAITVPARIIHALDDPFIPAATLPTVGQLPPAVTLEWSPHGGHVGFVQGQPPGHVSYWLDEAIPRMLAEGLSQGKGGASWRLSPDPRDAVEQL